MSRFPQMNPGEQELALPGTIYYKPWVRFGKEVMDKLQSIVETYYSPGGCENPEVLADFCVHKYETQDSVAYHRSEILLYRDGGDWGCEDDEEGSDIGFIFARRDVELGRDPDSTTTTYRVHLPPPTIQSKLLPILNDIVEGMKKGNTEALRMVQEYLSLVIDDESQWRNLADYPFPDDVFLPADQ